MNKSKRIGRNLVLYTLIVVALVLLLALVNHIGQEEPSETSGSFDSGPLTENQPLIGNPDAPVTVYEFGDFKCPACKVWNDQLFPLLMEEYIDTGKVNLVFINTLFHGEESLLASLAAESVFAQSPESYWDFHKAIYNAQPETDHDSAWVTPELMIELAENTSDGINLERLKRDIDDPTALSSQIEVDNALVTEFKVEKTPTIMVEGIPMTDPFDYETLKVLIDTRLGAESDE